MLKGLLHKHGNPDPDFCQRDRYEGRAVGRSSIRFFSSREDDVLRQLTGWLVETRSRVRGLVLVRDAVRACLRSQVDESTEEQIADARFQLNLAYDRFVTRFGPINLRANQRAFDGDPDLPLLLSL